MDFAEPLTRPTRAYALNQAASVLVFRVGNIECRVVEAPKDSFTDVSPYTYVVVGRDITWSEPGPFLIRTETGWRFLQLGHSAISTKFPMLHFECIAGARSYIEEQMAWENLGA